MGKLNDISLISQVVLFDNKKAFGQLVERYQDTVRRFLLHLCGDSELAYDLSQETFIRAYISLETFQGLSRFQTWILRIAYNQFYDYLKVKKNQQNERYDTLHEGQIMDHAGYREDLRMDIRKALQFIKPDERTAIVLFYMEELSVKQISKVMKCPEGSVKSHLHRGRAKLSEILKKENYENE